MYNDLQLVLWSRYLHYHKAHISGVCRLWTRERRQGSFVAMLAMAMDALVRKPMYGWLCMSLWLLMELGGPNHYQVYDPIMLLKYPIRDPFSSLWSFGCFKLWENPVDGKVFFVTLWHSVTITVQCCVGVCAGKHRKHPGGRGNAGGMHHHRINYDK